MRRKSFDFLRLDPIPASVSGGEQSPPPRPLLVSAASPEQCGERSHVGSSLLIAAPSMYAAIASRNESRSRFSHCARLSWRSRLRSSDEPDEIGSGLNIIGMHTVRLSQLAASPQ